MEKWLESVYRDSSAAFASDPHPRLFESVRIRLSMGTSIPKWEIFGKALEYRKQDDTAIELTAMAHRACFMERRMR